jgi:hypothetical protein
LLDSDDTCWIHSLSMGQPCTQSGIRLHCTLSTRAIARPERMRWRHSRGSSTTSRTSAFRRALVGSLGVPIPEEMPIIAAAVLSHEGIVRWWLALPVYLLGVLPGDVALYLGRPAMG